MFLAEKAGLNVARTCVESVLGRSVLMVERFDRTSDGGRILATSALTLTGLDESQARSGRYVEFLDSLRSNGAPEGTTTELFDASHSTCQSPTPAIIFGTTARSGETASQAIAYDGKGTMRNKFC